MSVFVAVYRSTFFKIGSGVTVAKIISQVHRMSLFVPHVFIYLYCVKILCQADHTSLYICATRLYVFVLPEDLVDAWIDEYIHAMPHVAGGPTVAHICIYTYMYIYIYVYTYMQCHIWQVDQLSHKDKEELLSRLQAAMGH